jgi:hypothetical protein
MCHVVTGLTERIVGPGIDGVRGKAERQKGRRVRGGEAELRLTSLA